MRFSFRMIPLRRERFFIQQAFGVTTNWLLFEKAERDPNEDLHLQFEAMAQLSLDEKQVARGVLEGLILKHTAGHWGNINARTLITDTLTQGA